MSTCGKCKWWYNTDEDNTDEIISPCDPDTFEPMENLPFEVKCCHCPKITFFERPIEPDGATVIDGSQYRANLITAPEFGCVHWASNNGVNADAKEPREKSE